jgi:aerotaxis receptor
MSSAAITGKEASFAQHEQLISTTDLQGRITYANDHFIHISGYTKDELIGAHHRIVRHPFMPKAAFENMWATLKKDQPWRGIVVNRCKDGGFYWVDAYVTPIYVNGEKVGYQSVRVKPSEALKKKATALYTTLNSGKNPLPSQWLSPKMLLAWVTIFAVLITMLVTGVTGQWLLGAVAVISELAIGGVAYALVVKPLLSLVAKSKSISNNPVMQYLYTGRSNGIGSIDYGLQMLAASNRTVLGRLDDFSGEIEQVVLRTEQIVNHSRSGMESQTKETEMVSAAVTELAASAQEISQNMMSTSEAVVKASDEAQGGRVHLDQIVAAISRIDEQMGSAEQEAGNLKQHTVEIEHVIGVITEIAEQTNLLALNAAIEAARAGEYGRGFAVVADEVRTLATRTKESTQSVRMTVENIVGSVGQVVNVLDDTKNAVTDSRKVSDKVEQVFDAVTESMQGISERTVSVASAAEEQTAVVDEIQRNVDSLRKLSQENERLAQDSERSTSELKGLQRQLNSMVKAFENRS